MLLVADGLFRLDVTIAGDTLRTIVRNLSVGALTMIGDTDQRISVSSGDVEAYEPSHSGLRFTLGVGADRVEVEIQLATLRFAERGTIRVTAQAIMRGPHLGGPDGPHEQT
jgi:hypothetical protein